METCSWSSTRTIRSVGDRTRWTRISDRSRLRPDGEVEGSVVFAGYGLTSSADVEKPYDSYAGLDVKDKIVMVLRFVPEEVDAERRAELNLHARVRYKALLAREAGAKASTGRHGAKLAECR